MTILDVRQLEPDLNKNSVSLQAEQSEIFHVLSTYEIKTYRENAHRA